MRAAQPEVAGSSPARFQLHSGTDMADEVNNVTKDGRWVAEHHSTAGVPCGWEIRVKNHAFRIVPGPNAQPAACGSCIDPEDEPTVNAELGWCPCDQPWRVEAMMLAYLQSRTDENWPKPAPADVSEDAGLLLAYMADQLGWTTHGGTVGGAWLTDDGREALANLLLAEGQPVP